LDQEEGVSSEELSKRSRSSDYNSEDNVAEFSSQAELSDHKEAFDQVLVSPHSSFRAFLTKIGQIRRYQPASLHQG
jgi:cellobiose-specific phosphotransferase system component IIB